MGQQRLVGFPHPRAGVGLTPCDHELRRSVGDLHELVHEPPPRGGLPQAAAARESHGRRGQRQARDDEAGGEHGRGGRQHHEEEPARGQEHRARDERRRNRPQVEVLQRLDVADETAQRVAGAQAGQRAGDERSEPLI